MDPVPLFWLRTLTSAARAELMDGLEERAFPAGGVIVRRGDPAADRMYIVTEGTVEVAGRLIESGDFFGERGAVLGEVPRHSFLARTDVRCLAVPGERVLAAARASPVLAQALAGLLTEREGVFECFNHFVAAVTDGEARGELDMQLLLERYERLEPLLHPQLSDPDTIDFDALEYSLRRLPSNVTRTVSLLLSEVLPSAAGADLTPVSGAMRRPAYELTPGETVVLLRESHSDVLDLTCALCAYTIETRKLRRRMASFSAADRDRLGAIWPEDGDTRLREIARQEEEVTVRFDRDLEGGGTPHYRRWIAQLIDAIETLTGRAPGDLPETLDIHVISSNTHSVTNCLNPFLQERGDEVLTWGEAVGNELVEAAFADPQDRVYALARDYRRASPEHELGVREAEHRDGVVWLEDTGGTGIAVQLIDVEKVVRTPIDPGVRRDTATRPSLIVNVDFAYGRQSERILALLLLTLGRRLASLNVLGKAGALVGARGDLLVPTVFIDQLSGHIDELPGDTTIEIESLAERAPGRAIHHGPMLTVAGTLLQNQALLNYYRRLRGAVGLEMEGSHQCRRLREARHAGLVTDSIPSRFAYYVSDLPLSSDSRLSRRLRAEEGVPPLYAATREILSAVLEAPA